MRLFEVLNCGRMQAAVPALALAGERPILLAFNMQSVGRKRRRTTWISALAVLGAWLLRVIPVIQVARTFARI